MWLYGVFVSCSVIVDYLSNNHRSLNLSQICGKLFYKGHCDSGSKMTGLTPPDVLPEIKGLLLSVVTNASLIAEVSS